MTKPKVINLNNDNIDFSEIVDASNDKDVFDDIESENEGERDADGDMIDPEVENFNGQGSPFNDSVEPFQETIEDRLLKRRYILKIRRYCKEFKEELSIYNVGDLECKNIDELKFILEECKFIVGTSNCNSNINMMANGVIMLGENILTANTPLNLNNPHKVSTILANNKDFQRNLKEFALEYDDWFYQRVEYRLVQGLLMAGSMVHHQNTEYLKQAGLLKGQTMDKEEEPEMKVSDIVDGSEKVSQNINKKYSDL